MTDIKICSMCGFKIKEKPVSMSDPCNTGCIMCFHLGCDLEWWESYKRNMKEKLTPECNRVGQRRLF